MSDAQRMCDQVQLNKIEINSRILGEVLDSLRASHANGGVEFAAVQVDPNPEFDWFAARNRLLEFDILPRLLLRREFKESLPNLLAGAPREPAPATTSCATSSSHGFKFESTFMFDGTLANILHMGGAYHTSTGNGKAEKELALAFCDALFEQRYAEVAYFLTFDAWTPWFHGIAWDWTAILWDGRKRSLFILAVTDTD